VAILKELVTLHLFSIVVNIETYWNLSQIPLPILEIIKLFLFEDYCLALKTQVIVVENILLSKLFYFHIFC